MSIRYPKGPEADPNGRDPHTSTDSRVSLVMSQYPRAIHAIGRVEAFCFSEHGPDNWKAAPDSLERATNSMYLHLLGEHSGELRDSKSDLLHAAHAARNAIARLELLLIQQHWTRTYPNTEGPEA